MFASVDSESHDGEKNQYPFSTSAESFFFSDNGNRNAMSITVSIYRKTIV